MVFAAFGAWFLGHLALDTSIYVISAFVGLQGFGIGLAMTFRVVHLHDGSIDFTSRPEEGTTFEMRFPAVEVGKTGSSKKALPAAYHSNR